MEYFTINKKSLPVSEDFLLPFLNPTSPGTNYWDPAPNVKIMDRQIGNSILQFGQLYSLIDDLGLSNDNLNFLDIGTGDGVIPKLLLKYTNIANAVGIDPFLAGEDITRRNADDNDNFSTICKVIDSKMREGFYTLDNLKDFVNYEHRTLKPKNFKLKKNNDINYKFHQYSAHELNKLDMKFDFIYCKAIEHINDWNLMLKQIKEILNPGGFFIIKHNSFFSYLGPHRYCVTMIPWGHLLLNDDEYKSYVHHFHKDRYDYTVNAYFNSLTYPRNTLDTLIRNAQDCNLSLKLILNESLRFSHKVAGFISQIKDFWPMVFENFPDLSSDEVFSGRYHLIFKKF